MLFILPQGFSRVLARILLSLTSLAAASGVAAAQTCAVTRPTSDGFLMLRAGPSTAYEAKGRLLPGDFFLVAGERCRKDFGSMLCSEDGRWVFVERVFPPQGGTADPRQGWVNGGFIRYVGCPFR